MLLKISNELDTSCEEQTQIYLELALVSNLTTSDDISTSKRYRELQYTLSIADVSTMDSASYLVYYPCPMNPSC
jgi:hypothetical protein